jgi:four helix bundle protein
MKMKDNYPVFIKWKNILSWLIATCGKYPKNVRFNIADRLTNLSLDVLENIIEAIYSKQKIYFLKKANITIEKIRILLQISADNKYISISQYEYITSELLEAGKMLGGWIKTCAEPER